MLGIMAAAVATAGCSSSMYSSSSPVASDDLYATHDRKALMEAEIERRAQEIAAEKAARAAAEAQREEAARQLAEYRESEDAQYDGILSDGYADSYEKRLRGFTPSEDEEPAPKTVYVSAYEPAYFNVTVIGDQVWVEPKYVSSLYGTWGSSVTVNLGLWGWGYPSWSWGWNWAPYSWYARWGWGPYYGWGYPYYASWGWGWGYPYYYGWGWGGYYPHHHWGGGGPHYGYNHRNTVYGRPRTGSGGTVSSVTGSTGRTGIPPGRHRDLRPVERLVDRHRLVERHRLSPGILRYESYRRHLVRQFLGEQRHLVPSGKRQLVDRQQSRRLYAGRRLIGKLPPRQHDRREQRHLVGKQL